MQRTKWHDPAHPAEIADLQRHLDFELSESTRAVLAAPTATERHLLGRFHVVDESYIWGVVPIPRVVRDQDRVDYVEVDILMSENAFVTVRKAHERAGQFEPSILSEMFRDRTGPSSGEMFYRFMEDVAAAYLELMNGLMDEIDELEEVIAEGKASPDRIHGRYSGLRKDLLQARRQVTPLLNSLAAIDDERIDIADRIFPEEAEDLVRKVKDDLMGVSQSIPLVADLLSGVRDFHQGVISQKQNERMEKLTIIASLLLVPTLIVGVYGQNFDRMPELHWTDGYAFSWFLIAVTTVIQLVIFWRLGWLGKKRSTPKAGVKDIGSVLDERDDAS
ncbi:MAG TPA: CorA family divalent cation transporter [Actinomycetota bacterium]|nr:CorA family divalent cation transporter [Actinomycetota bacterium]